MKQLKAMRILCAAVSLAIVMGAPGALAGGNKEAKKNEQLVWPLPPDKPRYRWLEQISDAKQFDKKGVSSFIDRLSGSAKAKGETLFRPIGVATDSRNRLIITAQLSRTVYVIDRERKQVQRLFGTQSMSFKTPMGVVVDDKDNIYVADSKLDSVVRFSPDGTPSASVGQADGLQNPTYMAVDNARRRLYVVSTRSHQVFVYNLDTLKLETKIGKRGSKKGDLSYPVGVAISPKNGTIAITNTESCSVELFNSDYKWIKRIGQCGSQLGDFTRPKGAAYDQEGNLYVVDNAFNNFQVFDSEGHLRMFVGTAGIGPGMFWMPNAIWIDKNNRIYVSEFYGNRVQVFQFLGSN